MAKKKTIQVSEATWTQLNQIKYRLNYGTIEDVIKALLEKV